MVIRPLYYIIITVTRIIGNFWTEFLLNKEQEAGFVPINQQDQNLEKRKRQEKPICYFLLHATLHTMGFVNCDTRGVFGFPLFFHIF